MLLDGFSCFNGKTRHQRIQIRIRIHLGGIKVQFFPPHQLLLLALFDNSLKEAPKHVQAIAQTDLAQRRVIGEQLIQIIPHIPAHTQSIRHLAQEQALGANVFEKHHQLQFKKHHRIDRRSSGESIRLAHQIIDKREVQHLLQVPVKMVLGNQFLQGHGD